MDYKQSSAFSSGGQKQDRRLLGTKLEQDND